MPNRRMTVPLHEVGCSGGSAAAIERMLARVPGVVTAYVNPVTDTAYLDVDETHFDPALLKRNMQELGLSNHTPGG